MLGQVCKYRYFRQTLFQTVPATEQDVRFLRQQLEPNFNVRFGSEAVCTLYHNFECYAILYSTYNSTKMACYIILIRTYSLIKIKVILYLYVPGSRYNYTKFYIRGH